MELFLGLCAASILYIIIYLFNDLSNYIKSYKREKKWGNSNLKIIFYLLYFVSYIGLFNFNLVFKEKATFITLLAIIMAFFFLILYAIIQACLFIWPNDFEGNKMVNFLNKLIFPNRFTINIIDGKGFVLYSKSERVYYYWTDFNSIELSHNNTKLVLKGNKSITLSDKMKNFRILLRSIPKSETYVKTGYILEFYSKLNFCEICGFRAIINNACLCCGHYVFGKNKKTIELNQTDYIKVCQLDFFKTMRRMDTFEIFYTKENNFIKDDQWKPLISRQDILDYNLALDLMKNKTFKKS